MSLIKCPECGKEVSDKAQACPQCAYPITPCILAPLAEVQTIEKTSKKYKIQLLIAAVIIVISLIFLFTGVIPYYVTGVGLFIGFIWYIIVRCLIWWNHD